MPNQSKLPPESRREQELADLIRKAQANPGVREVMEVYERAQATLSQAQPYLRGARRSVQSLNDRTNG